ncbi:MAG: hypothetical protein ABIG60_05915 [Patescibacteria group bacterium]
MSTKKKKLKEGLQNANIKERKRSLRKKQIKTEKKIKIKKSKLSIQDIKLIIGASKEIASKIEDSPHYRGRMISIATKDPIIRDEIIKGTIKKLFFD